jgi:hypothetical protein
MHRARSYAKHAKHGFGDLTSNCFFMLKLYFSPHLFKQFDYGISWMITMVFELVDRASSEILVQLGLSASFPVH